MKRLVRGLAVLLVPATVIGTMLMSSQTVRADDKPIVGPPIIKKDPPKPKKDGDYFASLNRSGMTHTITPGADD